MLALKSGLLLTICVLLASCGMSTNRTNAGSAAAQTKDQKNNNNNVRAGTALNEIGSGLSNSLASAQAKEEVKEVPRLEVSTAGDNGTSNLTTQTQIDTKTKGDQPVAISSGNGVNRSREVNGLSNLNTGLRSPTVVGSNIVAAPNSSVGKTNAISAASVAGALVADDEEILKRLTLAQQDVQKVYESLEKQDGINWWKILELDWRALAAAKNQITLSFTTEGKTLRSDIAMSEVRNALQVVSSAIDNMVDILSAKQDLPASAWPNLSQQFSKINNLLFVTPVKNDNSFRIGPNSNALQSGGIGSTAQQDEDSGPSTLPAEEETDSAGQGSSAGAALPVAPARIVPRGPQLLSAPAAIPLKN